jgi:hypothetical protein
VLVHCIDAYTHTIRSSTCESTDSLAELALTSPSAKARAQQLHAQLSVNTSGNAVATGSTTTVAADAAATAASAAAAAEQHNNSSSKLSLPASTAESDTPDATSADVTAAEETEREERVTSFGRVWPPPRYTAVTCAYSCTSYTHASKLHHVHMHKRILIWFMLVIEAVASMSQNLVYSATLCM